MLIYSNNDIAPYEHGKGNSWLPAAQQPWEKALWPQLSRNEVAPSVDGNGSAHLHKTYVACIRYILGENSAFNYRRLHKMSAIKARI